MKKKRVRRDGCLVLCGVLLWMLADAERVRQEAAAALALCTGTVIPSLFPFMVVSRLLLSLGFGEWVSPRLAGLMTPLFRLPGSAASALLLGLVGGYPIGVQTAAELYRTGLLTREEAGRLLTFCNNSNPVFLISVLGAGVFGSIRIGVRLFLVHLLAALLTGLLFRGGGRPRSRSPARPLPCRAVSFFPALTDAVKAALAGVLSVCAFVVVFYVAVCPLRALGGLPGAALVGTVELFSLTPLLPEGTPGFLLAAVCSGWGGLSVLAQTAAALDDTDLPLAPCVLGKATQAALSGLLALLFSPFF